MCFFIGFTTTTASPYCWRVRESCLSVSCSKKEPSCSLPKWGHGRQRQHRKMRPAMLARLLVQASQGCPRLRWAMVDHGSQLASSRRSLCQVQKLSYSCVSLSALEKTRAPIVGTSKSHVCLCSFSKNNHLARCLVSGVTDGRDNSRNNSARLC